MWIFDKSQYENILLTNGYMTSIYCIGLLLTCIVILLDLFHPVHPIWNCNLQQYCFGFGVVFHTLPILLRSDTILVVFDYVQNHDNVKRVPLQSLRRALTRKANAHYRKVTRRYFYIAIFIELIIGAMYTAVSLGVNDFEKDNITYDDEFEEIYYSCHQEMSGYIATINAGYASSLFALLAYHCYHTTHAKQIFWEIYAGLYGSTVAIIIGIFWLLMKITNPRYIFQMAITVALMMVGMITQMTLFFGTKIYRFHYLKQQTLRKKILIKPDSTFTSSETTTTSGETEEEEDID